MRTVPGAIHPKGLTRNSATSKADTQRLACRAIPVVFRRQMTCRNWMKARERSYAIRVVCKECGYSTFRTGCADVRTVLSRPRPTCRHCGPEQLLRSEILPEDTPALDGRIQGRA